MCRLASASKSKLRDKPYTLPQRNRDSNSGYHNANVISTQRVVMRAEFMRPSQCQCLPQPHELPSVRSSDDLALLLQRVEIRLTRFIQETDGIDEIE